MASMDVERLPDANAFLERAGDFLFAREAVHNLTLGLCSRLRTHPLLYGEQPYFAVALDGDRVMAATMRTPPHNLILTEVDDPAAIEPLADDAHAAFGSLPGVGGPREPVGRFAGIWETRSGAKAEIAMRMRIYEAEETRAPEGVAGRMRPYEDRDRELVIAWMDAFVDEAMTEPPPETSQEWLERRLDAVIEAAAFLATRLVELQQTVHIGSSHRTTECVPGEGGYDRARTG